MPFCYVSGCLPSGFIHQCKVQGSFYQGTLDTAPPSVQIRQAQSGVDAVARRKSLLTNAMRALLLRFGVPPFRVNLPV